MCLISIKSTNIKMDTIPIDLSLAVKQIKKNHEAVVFEKKS